MAAQFPIALKSFTTKVDLVDTIYADHVNSLQDEVRALETSLGVGTLVSDYSGTFAKTATWTSLSDRLANIEAGLSNGVSGTPYFLKTGGTIMANAGTVGVLVKSANTNTENLFETRDSSNTLGFRVDSTGTPYVGDNIVIYMNSTEYNNLVSNILQSVDVSGQVFNPFLLAGL